LQVPPDLAPLVRRAAVANYREVVRALLAARTRARALDGLIRDMDVGDDLDREETLTVPLVDAERRRALLAVIATAADYEERGLRGGEDIKRAGERIDRLLALSKRVVAAGTTNDDEKET